MLIIIDTQNDFISGALANEEAQKAVPKIVELIKSKKYGFMLFTRDTHKLDYLNTLEGKKLPVIHCIQDTNGWCINEDIIQAAIASKINFDIINKHTFGSKELVEQVDYRFNGYEEIHICGFCTDICVISNALALRMNFPNSRIFVHRNACAGVTPELHEAALKVMQSCQIDIV